MAGLDDALRQQIIDMARRSYRDLPLGGTTEQEYRMMSESMNSGAPSMMSFLAGMSGYSLAQQQQRDREMEAYRNMRTDNANIDNINSRTAGQNMETYRIGRLLPGEVGMQGAEIGYTGARTAGQNMETYRSGQLLPGEVGMQQADIGLTGARTAGQRFDTYRGRWMLPGELNQQGAETFQTLASGNNANASAYGTVNQEYNRNMMLPIEMRNAAEVGNLNVSRRAIQDQEYYGKYLDNQFAYDTYPNELYGNYQENVNLKKAGAGGKVPTTAPPVFGTPAGQQPQAAKPAAGQVPLPAGMKMDNTQQRPTDPVAAMKNITSMGANAVRAGRMPQDIYSAGVVASEKFWNPATPVDPKTGRKMLTDDEYRAIEMYASYLRQQPQQPQRQQAPAGERVVMSGPYAGLPVSQVPRAFGGTR